MAKKVDEQNGIGSYADEVSQLSGNTRLRETHQGCRLQVESNQSNTPVRTGNAILRSHDSFAEGPRLEFRAREMVTLEGWCSVEYGK